MPNVRTLQQSFGGGEVTPEFFGRIDDGKYSAGLATCRNFITLPHGPIKNRPGFEYVSEVKNSARRTRMIPFTYSTTQTFAIELGVGYFRFHTLGSTLVKPDKTPYEVVNPYGEDALFEIHYVQSADVLTLVHPKYPPAELRRLGELSWEYKVIKFATDLAAPKDVKATSSGGTGTTYNYVVTSIGSYGLDESTISNVASVDGNLFADKAYNTITWTTNGSQRYNVYKQANGSLYGYVGQSDNGTFTDNNIAANTAITPPVNNDPFVGVNNYPAAVSYFQQRRCFAGTLNQPQSIWMTKSGTESNLDYSLPTKDDDAIIFRVAAREANTIRHIVPLTSLVLLTSAAEWRITSINTDAVTPTSVSVTPQSYIGANDVQPQIINNNLIYSAARGGHVRELAYAWQASGFVTGDLSLRAPHLFDTLNIVDMAYAKAPYPICWFVSSNGNLLGLTYVPEQQVGSWHRHDTQGVFESICVVNEGDFDVVYAVIRRVINGKEVRYVECMAQRQFVDPAQAVFVDSSSIYSGVPVSHISGLDYLEGCKVSILADGAVMPQRTVVKGSIDLDVPASNIVIGLPYQSDAQTLPWAAQIDNSFAQGHTKNVNKVWLRVYRSSGINVGPNANNLTPYKQRKTENPGSPPNLVTDEIPIVISPSWNNSGQVFIRQSDPLPLTLVSMTLEVSVGG